MCASHTYTHAHTSTHWYKCAHRYMHTPAEQLLLFLEISLKEEEMHWSADRNKDSNETCRSGNKVIDWRVNKHPCKQIDKLTSLTSVSGQTFRESLRGWKCVWGGGYVGVGAGRTGLTAVIHRLMWSALLCLSKGESPLNYKMAEWLIRCGLKMFFSPILPV